MNRSAVSLLLTKLTWASAKTHNISLDDSYDISSACVCLCIRQKAWPVVSSAVSSANSISTQKLTDDHLTELSVSN